MSSKRPWIRAEPQDGQPVTQKKGRPVGLPMSVSALLMELGHQHSRLRQVIEYPSNSSTFSKPQPGLATRHPGSESYGAKAPANYGGLTHFDVFRLELVPSLSCNMSRRLFSIARISAWGIVPSFLAITPRFTVLMIPVAMDGNRSPALCQSPTIWSPARIRSVLLVTAATMASWRLE